MKEISRRAFLLSSIALPLGCTLAPTFVPGARVAGQNPTAGVRRPNPGQWWRYAKRDGFTGKLVETQVARITEVGETINIERQREAAERHRSWGSKWLLGDEPAGAAEIQGEVQQPWGMILVDPHWDLLQVYETPIPLWPTELRPGWSSIFNTKFKTPLSGWENSWQQTMHAHAWERIRVPAGEFLALRYTNRINFTHPDLSRTDCVREETLWLAPEVGRWVSRRTSGTYYLHDSIIDTPFDEDFYHCDLLEWS
ncbi:MAG: hypothetical protein M3O26_04820 [Pseudomonadota bacterium]|nr:hypothetical protein [Pseudomonadota bacterium]